MQSQIDDGSLAAQGAQRLGWYRQRMGVLQQFKERYQKEKPFAGKRIVTCMHCEPKGAVRTEVMLAGGAEEIVFVGNLGSTKPDTAAYLAGLERVTVLARKNDTLEDLNGYLARVLQSPADLLMDNGASILLNYYRLAPSWRPIGAIEETRSGQLLLERENIRPGFPVLVIDDSPVKRLIENEVGVGQSVVDGFMRSTSMLVGGKHILVVGYGYCGAGIAQRFRLLGADTMVYDIEPLRLLKAKIEGHRVGELDELLPQADVVVTVTGRFDVLGPKDTPLLRDGAVLCNAGHYNMEIDAAGLRGQAAECGRLSDDIELLVQPDGRRLFLLQNANPLNLSAGAGNPIEIMELGYALQLLSLEKMLGAQPLPGGIVPLPEEINRAACQMCLAAW